MESAINLVNASLEPNTKLVYKRAWSILKKFLIEHHLPLVLPLVERSMILFISYLFERKYAASTIQTMVSAISYIHQLYGADDPSKKFFIKKMLQGSKKINNSVDIRMPITLSILKQLIEAAESIFCSKYERVVFKAMCVLAFNALLRVGEMTKSKNNLQFDCIELRNDMVVAYFPRYKHNYEGGSTLYLPKIKGSEVCPVQASKQYIALRGNTPGPFFLKIDNTPFSRAQFVNNLKVALKFCGLSDLRYKTHSFRIGGATHLAQLGKSEIQIRQAGRWQSNAFAKYTRINWM